MESIILSDADYRQSMNLKAANFDKKIEFQRTFLDLGDTNRIAIPPIAIFDSVWEAPDERCMVDLDDSENFEFKKKRARKEKDLKNWGEEEIPKVYHEKLRKDTPPKKKHQLSKEFDTQFESLERSEQASNAKTSNREMGHFWSRRREWARFSSKG